MLSISGGRWPLPTAQRAIIVAGCLGMVYTQLSMSPATIQFARSLGANGLQFGILGALPTAMLFLQFVAALAANHLRYRRGVWLGVSLVQRLVLVPVALGPWLFPQVSDGGWVWGLILATALNHALLHFCTPLWLSWMGDYLPRQGLSQYWGARHLWMQWAGAAALLAAAVFLFRGGLEMQAGFAVLMCIAALFGVCDLLIFLKVEEPPVRPAAEPKLSARRIEEPQSSGARHVATLLIGATPLRMLRFPVGLYRNGRDEDDLPAKSS